VLFLFDFTRKTSSKPDNTDIENPYTKQMLFDLHVLASKNPMRRKCDLPASQIVVYFLKFVSASARAEFVSICTMGGATTQRRVECFFEKTCSFALPAPTCISIYPLPLLSCTKGEERSKRFAYGFLSVLRRRVHYQRQFARNFLITFCPIKHDLSSLFSTQSGFIPGNPFS
jgi:hypothetical protein